MILTFCKTRNNFVLADEEAQVQRTRDFFSFMLNWHFDVRRGKKSLFGVKGRVQVKSRK